ncbi:hypothetical protein [Clostridium sp. HBUAS56017]|uniref:hypothetical protein n=1 Tax=Clostridium sp. HBUAS56017 TaxID=2571128 RepID=UPI00117854F4|nr:hypothetical protein [Clostridium sp. HBUAS56017]
MKLIIISKKQILYFSILLIYTIMMFLLLIPDNSSKFADVFNPINIDKNNQIDLTGDGKKDTLSVISKNGFSDVQITSNNKTYYLSNFCNNNILASNSSYWPISLYVKNLGRGTCPQIIVQGTKDKKNINYIFTWENGNFKNILTSEKNILGIINSNCNKTPEVYNVNSFDSTSSFTSFMIINNKLLDITKDTKTPHSIDIIQDFINLIQKDYEVDAIPNIFKEGMSENELALLWNLDKEHNTYSFQNGFFYDENIDNEGNISSMRWKLNFEKFIKDKNDSFKSQLTIQLICQRTIDGSFKISSFYSN